MRRTRGERLASAPNTTLVALLFLLAHWGGLAHVAAVPHEVCARHNAVEHSSGAATAELAEDAACADAGPAVSDPPDGGEDGSHHETCLLSFLTRASAGLRPAEKPLSVLVPAEARARHVRDVGAPAAVPVFRLAPKHSPPALG